MALSTKGLMLLSSSSIWDGKNLLKQGSMTPDSTNGGVLTAYKPNYVIMNALACALSLHSRLPAKWLRRPTLLQNSKTWSSIASPGLVCDGLKIGLSHDFLKFRWRKATLSMNCYPCSMPFKINFSLICLQIVLLIIHFYSLYLQSCLNHLPHSLLPSFAKYLPLVHQHLPLGPPTCLGLCLKCSSRMIPFTLNFCNSLMT